MKKYFLLNLILIFCALTYGQDSKLILGFEFTPTLSSLKEDKKIYDTEPRLGFSSGFSLEYFISKQFSFRTSLNYERKGARVKLIVIDDDVDMGTHILYFNYDYLTLPLLASFSTNGKSRLYFNAGPYLGYLLSQKNIYNTGLKKTEDNTDNTKKIDFGLTFGLGLKIPLGNKLLLDLGLNDNFGLINVQKETAVYNSSIKTNSFGLQLGLQYKL
jgi:opacity protein-like surface antigen